MEWDFGFFIKSFSLGIGLAMDAFSVSLANGLNEPNMRAGKLCGIAGTFSFFQAAMPLIGWAVVHTAAFYFAVFERFIPWIALLLLGYIGGKMLFEGIGSHEEEQAAASLSFGLLLAQGVATSIDALSVGFTISKYDTLAAVVCALLIAAVTFVICMCGLFLGRKFGTKLSGKASILGGVILIAIGLEIFISSFI